MKKRLLAVLLSFAMVFSMLPTAVYAEDIDTAKTQSDSQEEAPDKIVVGTENGETDQEDPLKLLQDRVWALPDVEEFEAAEEDQQNAIYLEAQAIAEEYEQLSAEDQERLDVTRLMELFDYFNSLVEELNGSNCRTAVELYANTPASGSGWSWEGTTLTLNGANLVFDKQKKECSGIRINCDATIVVIGKNSITINSRCDDDILGIINMNGHSLTIKGSAQDGYNGVLNLSTGDSYADNHVIYGATRLTVQNLGCLTITAGKSADKSSYGVKYEQGGGNTPVSVINSCIVVTAKEADAYANAFYRGNVELTNSSGQFASDGSKSNKKVIRDNGNIYVDGKNAGNPSRSYATTSTGHITYHYQDSNGNWQTETQDITYPSSGIIPTVNYTPADRTGYTFAGWNTAENGTGTSYTNGDTTMNLLTQTDNTLHLYAEWNHAHIWQYEANGDTITATCAGGGDCPYKDSWPITVLAAEDAEYSGSVYNKAQIANDEISGVTGAAASGITYVGRDGTEYTESANAPTSAGKYTAKVSVSGVTAVKDFEITKAPSDANVTFAEGLVYNGKNQYLVERATTVGGTLMYRLSDAEEWQAGLVMLSKKDAGDYTIQYYVKGDANHNDSEVKNATVTIQQKELTVSGITIQDKAYDGNTDAKVASDCTPAVDGLVGNDTVTLKVTAVFDTKDAGEDKTVSLTYELEDSTGNYKLADTGHQTTATASITPKEITVSITPNGGVYGGTIVPASAVLTGVVDGETVDVTLTYTGTANDGTVYQSTEAPAKAGTYTVTATIADANYTLKTPNTAEFTVNRADPGLSISAVPDKNYGDDSFQLEVTQNGDGALTYESDDTDVLTVDENGQVTIKKAGTATIRVSVAETANYKEDTKTVEVTVNKVSGSLEVTALSYVKTYGDAPFRITATSTTGTVTYSSSNEDVATVAADGTVTIHNKGMATITVSVPEDENYIAVSKTISVTVMPKAITVRAKDASKIYGDVDPELTYEVLNDGLVGDDTLKDIKVEREPGEDVKDSGYVIDVYYNGTLIQSILNSVFGSDPNGNYNITFETGVFTINPKSITVKAKDASKVYGDADPELTYEVLNNSLVGKDTLKDIKVERETGEDVKASGYAISVSGSDVNANYSITYVPGVFTINPKSITVKAKDASKVYGDADPELTYEVLNNSLVGKDTLKDIKVERETGEDVKAGGYAISVSGSDANANYDITFEAGVFTINPRDISKADVTLGDALTENGKKQTQTVVKVVADGIEVPADAYTLEGNTAKEAGTYTLKIVAKEGGNFTGVRECSYTVAKENEKPVNPPNVPQTGDNSQAPLWITLMLVSICGMAGVLLVFKKSRNKGKNIK